MHVSGTTRALCAILAVVVASWGPIGCACSCAKAGSEQPSPSRQDSCCDSEERGSADGTAATAAPPPCHTSRPTDTPGKCDCGGCNAAAVGSCESQSVAPLVPSAKRIVPGTQTALATPALIAPQQSWRIETVCATGPPEPSRTGSLFSLHCLLTT